VRGSNSPNPRDPTRQEFTASQRRGSSDASGARRERSERLDGNGERSDPWTTGASRSVRTGEARENAPETDQWGYTETEPLAALEITDLGEREADLIEHFMPVAVDEAGGFANFRETATKTNSLVDRLKAVELPDSDAVVDDLDNYLRTVARAEELDEKIAKTDDLIDEIVYELYGLTDEEIEIVEETVGK